MVQRRTPLRVSVDLDHIGRAWRACSASVAGVHSSSRQSDLCPVFRPQIRGDVGQVSEVAADNANRYRNAVSTAF